MPVDCAAVTIDNAGLGMLKVDSPVGKQLVWDTKRDGERVRLTAELAEDRLRQFEVNLLRVLPIEEQL